MCMQEVGGIVSVCAGRKAAVRTQNRCSLLRTNVLQTQDPRCTATYFTLINPEVATVTCKKSAASCSSSPAGRELLTKHSSGFIGMPM